MTQRSDYPLFASMATVEESIAAGKKAMGLTERCADEEWAFEAECLILSFEAGFRFMPDYVVERLRLDRGLTTHNTKAIGPIIQRLARDGFIKHSGRLMPVKTSHGSKRPEWERTAS